MDDVYAGDPGEVGNGRGRGCALLAGLLATIIGAAAAVVVIPGDGFQTLVAAHFKQEINGQAGVDAFVSALVERQDDRYHIVRRVLGRRIEIETTFDEQEGSFRVKGTDTTGDLLLDQAGEMRDLRLTTTRCPASVGRAVPLYVYLRGEVDNGRFARYPFKKRIALNGSWDVDPIRSALDGSYCTVDLRLHLN